MMVSTGLAILADLYPGPDGPKPRHCFRWRISRPFCGPWLGGLIATHLGWRWIFYIGAVPCVMCLLLTLKVLPVKPIRQKCPPFDWGGAVLCAIGMTLLSQGGSHFHDLSGKIMLGVGVLSLAAFVLWESHAKAPLLDMRLFRGNPSFSLGSAVQFISYAATFGITFLLSLYLQVTQGMTASEAGIVLVAQPVMQAIFPLSAATGVNAGPRIISQPSVWDWLHWDWAERLSRCAKFPAAHYRGACSVRCGQCHFRHCTWLSSWGGEQEYYGVASAVVAGMRTTGMTVSLVFISAVFAMVIGPQALHAESSSSYIEAMHIIFIALTVFSALGVFMSARARRRLADK